MTELVLCFSGCVLVAAILALFVEVRRLKRRQDEQDEILDDVLKGLMAAEERMAREEGGVNGRVNRTMWD